MLELELNELYKHIGDKPCWINVNGNPVKVNPNDLVVFVEMIQKTPFHYSLKTLTTNGNLGWYTVSLKNFSIFWEKVC